MTGGLMKQKGTCIQENFCTKVFINSHKNKGYDCLYVYMFKGYGTNHIDQRMPCIFQFFEFSSHVLCLFASGSIFGCSHPIFDFNSVEEILRYWLWWWWWRFAEAVKATESFSVLKYSNVRIIGKFVWWFPLSLPHNSVIKLNLSFCVAFRNHLLS